ncbi:GNAT family N-acetyltransferase [Hamadaea sp. NPDC050747]|uniref:GNAT family N-acetyltransferase n=1 Tax=Hamadaea sp. NPDC050747 TaxID=3155789 RepID=UPI0033EA6056
MRDGDFARYLRSLTASWRGLAARKAGASVVVGSGYVVARFPDPYVYLNNAVILVPDVVATAADMFSDHGPHALWCLEDAPDVAAVIAAHGYAHTETTRPMLRRLDELPPADKQVIASADLDRFAELIEVPPVLLRDVPGLLAYATAGYESGLVLQYDDYDVYVSMVYTKPEFRGHGLATAVLTAALTDARCRGACTATLQSTPMADGMYLRHGFTPLGRWLEWTRQ